MCVASSWQADCLSCSCIGVKWEVAAAECPPLAYRKCLSVACIWPHHGAASLVKAYGESAYSVQCLVFNTHFGLVQC